MTAELEERLLDDPDDAGAWAAYGAWLRAQGDPRGDWFGFEALAATPEERALVSGWLARERVHRAPVGAATGDCEWRHGFAVAVKFHVRGRRDARELRELMADPRSQLVSRLELGFADEAPARGLSALAQVELGRLRTLLARYHGRGNQVARALRGQSALNLRVLDLRHSGLTDEGLVALAGCAALGGLRALYLQRNRFTGRGLAALAGAPALSRLEVLDLRYNPIGPAGAAALAESSQLGGLTALHVHAAEIEAEGVRALASSTRLPRDLVRFWRAQEAR
ncbi:Leucine Rich repeat [Nannocystis exedens]|uniref:Leucine Rich repeat n=1 Tax=Nannocystis exedens TaxID=54 RepID=A0A1I1WRQ0_9BACT|nr:hypothetical protein [Nannocystis exedens]PCC67826.1 Leucine Rich repeats (2 copies) [Nannocystis exedens]SFD95770.1 Leucine Rich repeat [Nannocystis exedens]